MGAKPTTLRLNPRPERRAPHAVPRFRLAGPALEVVDREGFGLRFHQVKVLGRGGGTRGLLTYS